MTLARGSAGKRSARESGRLGAVCLCAAGVTALCLCACGERSSYPSAGGGDADRGAAIIAAVGCGACHEIPGIGDADGRVGPPLARFSRRTVLAGMLPNTPSNLRRWIRQPQAIAPGNAMPDAGLSERDARDVAAYLYTLD